MSSFEFLVGGETVASTVENTGGSFKVTIEDRVVELLPAGDNLYTAMINGRRTLVAAIRHKEKCYVDIDSVLIELAEPSDDAFGAGADELEAEKDKVFAPMPGKVVKLLVNVGDEVKEKQQLVVVEAMKMENVVLSRANGTVKAINFAAGDQVDTNTPIIELEVGE